VNDTSDEGIPTYKFQSPASLYDTTLDENRGFRYENSEQVDYFNGWPNCPSPNISTSVDCSFDVDCYQVLFNTHLLNYPHFRSKTTAHPAAMARSSTAPTNCLRASSHCVVSPVRTRLPKTIDPD
jgi:hypothetical protein